MGKTYRDKPEKWRKHSDKKLAWRHKSPNEHRANFFIDQKPPSYSPFDDSLEEHESFGGA